MHHVDVVEELRDDGVHVRVEVGLRPTGVGAPGVVERVAEVLEGGVAAGRGLRAQRVVPGVRHRVVAVLVPVRVGVVALGQPVRHPGAVAPGERRDGTGGAGGVRVLRREDGPFGACVVVPALAAQQPSVGGVHHRLVPGRTGDLDVGEPGGAQLAARVGGEPHQLGGHVVGLREPLGVDVLELLLALVAVVRARQLVLRPGALGLGRMVEGLLRRQLHAAGRLGGHDGAAEDDEAAALVDGGGEEPAVYAHAVDALTDRHLLRPVVPGGVRGDDDELRGLFVGEPELPPMVTHVGECDVLGSPLGGRGQITTGVEDHPGVPGRGVAPYGRIGGVVDTRRRGGGQTGSQGQKQARGRHCGPQPRAESPSGHGLSLPSANAPPGSAVETARAP